MKAVGGPQKWTKICRSTVYPMGPVFVLSNFDAKGLKGPDGKWKHAPGENDPAYMKVTVKNPKKNGVWKILFSTWYTVGDGT